MSNNIQHVSIEQLDSFSFGDKEFKKELIKIFLEQIPEFISKMKKFIDKGELGELAKEAHKAKSSVLIFGMTETGTSLTKIQLHAEKKNTKQLSALIDKVETEMNRASIQLEAILKSM